MNRFLRTYTFLTLWRTVLLFAVLMLCRVIFVLYNGDAFEDIEWSEVPRLIYGGLRFDIISFCYALGVWVIFSLLPLYKIREQRWYCNTLFWYYIVAGGICVAVNLADAVYFRYTRKRFTAEEIFFANNSNSVQLMFKFAVENWYLVMAGVVLIALLAWGYRRRTQIEVVLNRWSYYTFNTIVLLLTVVLCVVGIRGGLNRMSRPPAIPYSLKFAKSGDKANIVLSNPFCILRTIGDDKISVPRYFDRDSLQTVYTPYHIPQADRDFKPYNVVIFVMESMSAENSYHLCPELFEGESEAGYTPFLDSLMTASLTFKRMYANGKRSIQALPSIYGSIPSLVTPFVLMSQSLGQSRAMPTLLRERGYQTAFFCGSERGSMGFDAYALAAGFERCFSKEDYEDSHGYRDFDGYWGIFDDKYLGYMGEEISQLKEPFLASVFTTSSHHPFVLPEDWRSRLPKGKNLFQPCVSYLDGALERFFEQNRDKEWFDRTIFVFVADHVCGMHFAERTLVTPGDFHIIGFIYTPDGLLESQEIEEPVSQIDIMPTLLGILGYDKPYFGYGRDVLAQDGRMPITIVYDNGVYKGITKDRVYIFREGAVREIYDTADIATKVNLIDTEADPAIENMIKGYIQQYYEHAERKSYIVPDSLSTNNADR